MKERAGGEKRKKGNLGTSGQEMRDPFHWL
jgi:hypothetical protein